MDKIYDTYKSIEVQSKYCKDKNLPNFTPLNGRCYKCKKDIYKKHERDKRNRLTGEITGTYKSGIDVSRAGSEHIIGCPHCFYSFCN